MRNTFYIKRLAPITATRTRLQPFFGCAGQWCRCKLTQTGRTICSKESWWSRALRSDISKTNVWLHSTNTDTAMECDCLHRSSGNMKRYWLLENNRLCIQSFLKVRAYHDLAGKPSVIAKWDSTGTLIRWGVPTQFTVITDLNGRMC